MKEGIDAAMKALAKKLEATEIKSKDAVHYSQAILNLVHVQVNIQNMEMPG